MVCGPGHFNHICRVEFMISEVPEKTVQPLALNRSKMRALLLLCTVGIVMASVINLTSARYMPQGYNARAPARSMQEPAAGECIT